MISARLTYFRQSGWMVMAMFMGGVFMFLVHVVAPYLGGEDYGLFGTLLNILNLVAIPALGLQTVMARETAAASTDETRARLAGTVRGLLRWILLFWIVLVLAAFVFQRALLNALAISNPVALWLTLLAGLGVLCQPVLLGVLQGLQNFLWFGWTAIVNGVVRFLAVITFVILLGGATSAAMAGVLLGATSAVALAAFHGRTVWRGRTAAFELRPWLMHAGPLALGLGMSMVMFSSDMIIVKVRHGAAVETGWFAAAGMIGRGLVMFTLPLAMVMFPKVVRDMAGAPPTRVLGWTLLATGILGVGVALGCTGLSVTLLHLAGTPAGDLQAWPQSLVNWIQANGQAALFVGRLIPWFVWSMLPLAIANVLLNHLMAQGRYRVVPWLIVVALAYVTTAALAGTTYLRVVQILGVFNLLFLAVLLAFILASPQTGSQSRLGRGAGDRSL
ncbi:MAG TPA: hypothetical protein VMS21_14045 [Methylomirabilota bacterium]|nr:hypothetical protein [Methylomirabilota bacterium]